MQNVNTDYDNQTKAISNRQLKIALLGYRSHPFVGGQGIYIKYLSRALRALGHIVHVYSGPPYPDLDDDISLIKVPSLNLYEEESHLKALRWKHLRSYTDLYEWWTMASGGFGEPYTFGRRVFKLLKNSDYDIIHDNQSLSHALLELQRSGHRVISTIHHPIHKDRELALQDEDRFGYRVLIRRWYSFLSMQEKVARKLKHVCTVSRQSQLDIETHFDRSDANTPIIHNGVDTEVFRPLPETKPDRLRLLTTSSSDHPLKGLKYLLKALHTLTVEFPEMTLTIVGKLKEDGECSNYIKRHGLEQHVECVSGLDTEDLVALYSRASAVVCPSLYEGFGLPAAEALACAKPVIAANAGALPEVVGDAGILVQPADSEALAEAIKKVLENEVLQKQMSSKARQRAEQQFCWDKVGKQFQALYYSMIDGN